MERKVYKLKIHMDSEGGGVEFRDFYLDMNKVCGWYMPNKHKDFEGIKAVNLMYESGEVDTYILEDNLKEYLMKNFVEKAECSLK